MDIKENIARVQERIVAACGRSGRHPEYVKLVAVTKTVPPERIRELRKAAKEAQLTVVDFTTLAQTAKTYDEYRTSLASSNDSEVSYLGIALLGDGQTVRSLTGSLALLR